MRKMQGRSLGELGVCTVVEHIIIKNGWEYYILKTDLDEDDDKYKTALVVGDYNEIGGVHMPEIEPHIISRTRDLSDVLPAPNWKWMTDKEVDDFFHPQVVNWIEKEESDKGCDVNTDPEKLLIDDDVTLDETTT